MNLASKTFADAWSAAADEAAGKQCEAYGAGVVMLVPERLRINWKDDQTLQVQTDAGMQTRLLHFQPAAAPAEASWQGYSKASWMLYPVAPVGGPPAGRGGRGGPGGGGPPAAPPVAAPASFGSLTIATDHMLPGLLRKNGLPYSGQSSLLEYWELQRDPITQTQYLLVTAALSDPVYLLRPYYYTVTFKKEADDSKWDPTPCTLSAAP
jgi:hypothetical protein